MHSYTDVKGNMHEITDEELSIAVDTKLELQKAGNGTCNWSKLCKMLHDQGIDAKRCENFRVLVRTYQKSQGKLRSAKKMADMLSENRLQAIDEEIGELNLQKRELQLMKNDFGKLRRYVTDVELDKRKIFDLAKQNVHIEVTQHEHVESNRPTSSESMIVTLSDLHVGAVTDLANSQYNSDIAYSYLLTYANKIVDLINEKRPKEVFITNLGDMIEGSFMRYNQSFDIDLTQSQQQSKAIEYITSFIGLIYEHTSNLGIDLYYTGIAGNHDRSNGNKKDNLNGDSFITVLNTVIKLMTDKLEGFEFLEPDTETRTKIFVQDHWIKLVHGDFDNLNKPTILSELSQLDGIHYDALLGGHKHSLMIRENNGIIAQTGSIVGNTNYSQDLAVSASRSQLIMYVTKNTLTPVPIQLELPAVLHKN